MPHTVLIILLSPSSTPQGYIANATDNEIVILETVNHYSEDDPYDNVNLRLGHLYIMHKLGNIGYYSTEEEFNAQMEEWIENDEPEQDLFIDPMQGRNDDNDDDYESGQKLSWEDYGTWATHPVLTDCRSASLWYTISINM